MQIKTVEISLGITHNLGNYSNISPSISLSAVVSEHELPSTVLEVLRLTVLEEIDTLIKQAIRQHNARKDEKPF